MSRRMNCDFCGRSLEDEPYRIETRHGGMTGYHDRCLQNFEGYRQFKAAHDHHCHLDGCQRGPKDPFIERTG